MAKKTILILGREGISVEKAEQTIDDPDVTIFAGTNIDDVKQMLEQVEKGGGNIDHVFMGAGIDIEKRLDIIRLVFEMNAKTTVHLKDRTSGPGGMLPFTKATLEGLKGYEML